MAVKLPAFAESIIQYFKTNHSLEAIDPDVLVRWGCMGAILLIIAFWHQHQNRVFHEYLRNNKKRTPLSDRLSQLAYNRSFETSGLFLLLILVVVFYDTRVAKLGANLESNQKTVASLEQNVQMLSAGLEAYQTELTSERNRTKLPENIEMQLDDLKRKYEELFINYYYLKRCNSTDPLQFHVMNSALTHELTLLNAPAGVRQKILSAAKGTHDELYASAPCDEKTVTSMQKNVAAYLDQVMENVPDE